MWTLVLRGGAVLSIAVAAVQLFDQFFREINPNRLYSTEEAALLLGMERRAVVRLIRRGEIRCRMSVDGNYRILGQRLLEYVNR